MDCEKRIENLENITTIQCTDGTWDYDNYNHGMANSLILALAIMKGGEPKFLNPPKQWLCDIKPFNTISVFL